MPLKRRVDWTGDRAGATSGTALYNLGRILREENIRTGTGEALDATRAQRRMREELQKRVHPSFRRGGRVKRTGVYKLHKGEQVISAKRARRLRRKNRRS